MHRAPVANVQALVNDPRGVMVFLRSLSIQRFMHSLSCYGISNDYLFCQSASCKSCDTFQKSLNTTIRVIRTLPILAQI